MKHLATALDLQKALFDKHGVVVIVTKAEQQVISDKLLADDLFMGVLAKKDVTVMTMGPWGSIETKGSGKLIVHRGKTRGNDGKGDLFYFDDKIRFDVL